MIEKLQIGLSAPLRAPSTPLGMTIKAVSFSLILREESKRWPFPNNEQARFPGKAIRFCASHTARPSSPALPETAYTRFKKHALSNHISLSVAFALPAADHFPAAGVHDRVIYRINARESIGIRQQRVKVHNVSVLLFQRAGAVYRGVEPHQ